MGPAAEGGLRLDSQVELNLVRSTLFLAEDEEGGMNMATHEERKEFATLRERLAAGESIPSDDVVATLDKAEVQILHAACWTAVVKFAFAEGSISTFGAMAGVPNGLAADVMSSSSSQDFRWAARTDKAGWKALSLLRSLQEHAPQK